MTSSSLHPCAAATERNRSYVSASGQDAVDTCVVRKYKHDALMLWQGMRWLWEALLPSPILSGCPPLALQGQTPALRAPASLA